MHDKPTESPQEQEHELVWIETAVATLRKVADLTEAQLPPGSALKEQPGRSRHV